MKIIPALIFFLTISHISLSQVKVLEEDQVPGKGNVSDLSWMVGYWTGPGLGGECEEVWMPAVDGHMIGTFRMWQDGELVFSEFMNMIQDGESVSLKLKHFNPDLTGWEEKDKWTTFKLIEMGSQEAYFSGLTFKRSGDQLSIFLSLIQNGERKIEEFRFTRTSL
ncbi:DUF6265 family protein [Algoriphagus mannitolivorans]|uniref:DUF6265 family protein n=1 Tax=Algoriphagus mannitolivorans TaxID=226504 RepID=UPI000411304B|nr:DUF6265 family protein [Algoriphagus mannitolivorans]